MTRDSILARHSTAKLQPTAYQPTTVQLQLYRKDQPKSLTGTNDKPMTPQGRSDGHHGGLAGPGTAWTAT